MEGEHWTEKIFKMGELQSMYFTLCGDVFGLDSDRNPWVMLKNSEESMILEVVHEIKTFLAVLACIFLHRSLSLKLQTFFDLFLFGMDIE